MNQPNRKIIQCYPIAIILITLLFLGVYAYFPTLRTHMIMSNEILDVTTAIAFILTFAVGLFYSLCISPPRYRNIYLLIPLTAFVGFFSEVRLGLHPFAIKLIHQLGINQWGQLLGITALICFVSLITVTQYLRQFADFESWLNHNVPMIIFSIGFIGFFVASILLDTQNMWAKRSIVFAEELCELQMSISLLFCAIYLHVIAEQYNRWNTTIPHQYEAAL